MNIPLRYGSEALKVAPNPTYEVSEPLDLCGEPSDLDWGRNRVPRDVRHGTQSRILSGSSRARMTERCLRQSSTA